MRVAPILTCFGLLAMLAPLGGSLPRAATAAPDNTRGMAMLAAYVSADGTLLDGAGATSATRSGPGLFKVVFKREVGNCSFTPTRAHRAGVNSTPGMVSASLVLNQNNAVGVRVFAANGTLEDGHFQILLFCHQ